MRTRVLDLDGSLAPQAESLGVTDRVAAREWGPRIRLACGFGTFRRFRRWLGAEPGEPALTFYGSGDFHHVTLALLGRLKGPFNLLVLDGHPDWMRAIPFLHCGTWLHHALRLPGLRRVFHCGGERDFDNGYGPLAPWREIRDGRVVVFPARRRFTRGRWSRLPVRPLLAEGASPVDVLDDGLRPFRRELGEVPLYVSIDKDVLVADDAAVNWESGLLRLDEAAAVVETFVAAAGGRLAGADVLGDWSPVRLGHWLSRLCDRVDRPSITHDPAAAAALNRRANAALLRASCRARRPARRQPTSRRPRISPWPRWRAERPPSLRREPTDRRPPQRLQPRLDRVGRVRPREPAADVRARELAPSPRLLGMLEHVTHRLPEHGRVGLGQPRVVRRLDLADPLLGEPGHTGQHQERVRRVAEVQGRPVSRDDRRRAAGHRLGDRQAEALAAVGMHEAVAAPRRGRPTRPCRASVPGRAPPAHPGAERSRSIVAPAVWPR